MHQTFSVRYFKGSKFLTDFRENQLLAKIQESVPTVKSIAVNTFYIANVNKGTSIEQLKKLEALLPEARIIDSKNAKNITENLAQSGDINGSSVKVADLFVLPRIGTISPWSSNATDVAKICDLDFLERVERGLCYSLSLSGSCSSEIINKAFLDKIHDPMTQSVLQNIQEVESIFESQSPGEVSFFDVMNKGKSALIEANQKLHLGLSNIEVNYLHSTFSSLNRNPTDAELMMFAQVNSEHCRHKIFNAIWEVDGKTQENSLFSMIRNTYKQNSQAALVAYDDNAAVLYGDSAKRLMINPQTKCYEEREEHADIVFKVETHNHPTAISPFAGAATGSGGEIRDEAATGRGARTKMGLVGFSLSHLRIPNFTHSWEIDVGRPDHMASALQIIIEAPIGAASFNNEFGRPNLCGYFRTFGFEDYGYHKPIMISGGVGNIRRKLTKKKILPIGAKLVVLGGPAMSIGIGGGAVSSKNASDTSEEADFSSVQRSNPEMQRRCQEVIDTCWSMGESNPILSIHDVGAGGLSNALPELVEACDLGAHIKLRDIHNAAPNMTPMEVWCNEAQERYVLSINSEDVSLFEKISRRERCPFAVVGEVIEDTVLRVEDKFFDNNIVNMPMSALFKSMPRMHCKGTRKTGKYSQKQEVFKGIDKEKLRESVKNILQFPCVASKNFLITIGDRTVTGLVARDQMVGAWQVPVSNVAVTCSDYKGYKGEALAMGERSPIAILNYKASARMAIGEAITNICSANISSIGKIALSANWMASVKSNKDAAGLFDAVQAVGMEVCPALGISIPVGKDSLSMKTEWKGKDNKNHSITSPLSLIISAAAAVKDVRRTLTPELTIRPDKEASTLIMIDLGLGNYSMGGSVYQQIEGVIESDTPDLRDTSKLKSFFSLVQDLNEKSLIHAYHDRSDGGLLAVVSEMMFASRVGIKLNLDDLHTDPIRSLFSEELGAVMQIKNSDLEKVKVLLKNYNLNKNAVYIGAVNTSCDLEISHKNETLFKESRVQLQKWWTETSYRIQSLRDNTICADQEFKKIQDIKDPGLNAVSGSKLRTEEEINKLISQYNSYPKSSKPKVAILREQGVNGHIEMAAAFDKVGFSSIDVHMTDIISGSVKLENFSGVVACGGFSYGDILGAGRGWAQSILMHNKVREDFKKFFSRRDTFTLGVCNGCQMLSQLKSIIPGAEEWPSFIQNQSEQFEARLSMVKVESSPSIFFKGMEGSTVPIAVAHGEGRAYFRNTQSKNLNVVMRYVDSRNRVTETYPDNPNGSPNGITSLTTEDGRVTIMMPHPERVFRAAQFSWKPLEWKEHSPWINLFLNARQFVENIN